MKQFCFARSHLLGQSHFVVTSIHPDLLPQTFCCANNSLTLLSVEILSHPGHGIYATTVKDWTMLQRLNDSDSLSVQQNWRRLLSSRIQNTLVEMATSGPCQVHLNIDHIRHLTNAVVRPSPYCCHKVVRICCLSLLSPLLLTNGTNRGTENRPTTKSVQKNVASQHNYEAQKAKEQLEYRVSPASNPHTIANICC